MLVSDLAAAEATAPVLSYRIVAKYPHDIRHFTQGLEISAGKLYESTGGYGKSGIFINDLRGGPHIRQASLPSTVFGEGLTVLVDRIFVLTWRDGVAIAFDRNLKETQRFPLPREGWGMTHMPTLAGERLVASDGSSRLYFLDPETMRASSSMTVTSNGSPVERLNELEYARGDICANVWISPKVAVIQTGTGRVRAWIDFSGLPALFAKPPSWNPDEHVLNGIAFDESSGHFFITGKCWPTLFEVDIQTQQ